MKKTVKKVLSGILALTMSASLIGCAPSNDLTAIKAPTASGVETVSSQVTETEEVGLSSGFELPYQDGKVDNIYVYESDLYYHNNEKNDGGVGGLCGCAVSLCYLNLKLFKFVDPNDRKNAECKEAEDKRGNESHDLLDACLFCHFVAVFCHYDPHIEAVDTASDVVENKSNDPIEFFHNDFSFPL